MGFDGRRVGCVEGTPEGVGDGSSGLGLTAWTAEENVPCDPVVGW